MATTVAAAIAAFEQKMSRQNHQAAGKVIINVFDKFVGVRLVGFCFENFLFRHKFNKTGFTTGIELEILYCRPRP